MAGAPVTRTAPVTEAAADANASGTQLYRHSRDVNGNQRDKRAHVLWKENLTLQMQPVLSSPTRDGDTESTLELARNTSVATEGEDVLFREGNLEEKPR